ncbi:MAG: hypothetical protein K2L51_07665, partial [Clostridiales bacterium]|nr:hypothetical protein [Clostridiales bacterium]
MKTKSLVRRNGLRAGMGALFCILLLTVGLVFGTGTSTSAMAADPEVYATVDGVNLYVVSFDSAESVSEPFSTYSYSKDVSKAYL